jgi:hypothetical protein
MSQQNYLTRVTGVTLNPETPPHYDHQHQVQQQSQSQQAQSQLLQQQQTSKSAAHISHVQSAQVAHDDDDEEEDEEDEVSTLETPPTINNSSGAVSKQHTTTTPNTTTAVKKPPSGPRPPTSAATMHLADSEESTPQSGQSTIMIRSLVTTKEAGVIIGKGGQNVAAVRDATGVKAGVSKVIPNVHERILSITGTTLSVAKVGCCFFFFSFFSSISFPSPPPPSLELLIRQTHA